MNLGKPGPRIRIGGVSPQHLLIQLQRVITRRGGEPIRGQSL